jgi:hypothetical protein
VTDVPQMPVALIEDANCEVWGVYIKVKCLDEQIETLEMLLNTELLIEGLQVRRKSLLTTLRGLLKNYYKAYPEERPVDYDG